MDTSRLEYVLPYSSHRAGLRKPGSRSVAVDAEDEALRALTLQATPHYAGLFGRRDQASRAKAKYLLRDTLKVVGSASLGLEAAACGVFYVDGEDAMKGGTGHTLRVCREQQVLVAMQEAWMRWPA